MSELGLVQPAYMTRAQARRVDQVAIEEFGFTGLMLMENAAAGAARCLQARYRVGDSGVLVVCGGGNNGGDGLVMARHLYIARIPVGVILAADPSRLSGDCAVNWRILRRTEVPAMTLPSAAGAEMAARFDAALAHMTDRLGKITWVVDAMLGTGAQGPLRSPYDLFVDRLNEWSEVRRMALDLPTGWDCDAGLEGPCAFRADLTYTFVRGKQSFTLPAATDYVGEIAIGEIGIPPEVMARVFES